MLKSPILLFLIFFIALSCNQTALENESSESTSEADLDESTGEVAPLLEVNLEHALEEGGLDQAIIVDVPLDPVFKKAKKYEAIPLKPFLKKAIATQNLNTSNTEIIFLCKDGYNPGMPLSKVMENDPYLAIRDLDAIGGENWMDTLQGKWTPFYLIWTNHSQGAKGYAWPYGLKYLQFKASDEAYRAATPVDKNHLAGFELYKSKCMKCHSMNMVGGVMGPEMNVPKNITEYWQEKDIRAFVKNPYAYRYNSKMPPVVGITDKQIDEILAYLSYMKGQKVEVE